MLNASETEEFKNIVKLRLFEGQVLKITEIREQSNCSQSGGSESHSPYSKFSWRALLIFFFISDIELNEK